MDRKQTTWITCILLVPSILSASVIFGLAEIHVDTFLTGVIYITSLAGFFYLYLSVATFALKKF